MSAPLDIVTDADLISQPATKDTTASPFATTTPPPLTSATSHDDAAAHRLAPLTSSWSRPSSCTWTYAVDIDSYQPVSGQVAVLDLHPVPSNKTLSCYPSGMFDGPQTGVFSPAICPYGWTTASARVNTHTDEALITTTAICCSSSYTLNGSLCKLSLPTLVARPMAYNQTASTYSDLPISKTTLLGAIAAVHTMQALFQEHDKPGLNLSDDKLIGQDDGRRRELPLNARIGIGVGAALLGILVSIAAVCFSVFWRRKRRSAANSWGGDRLGPDGEYEWDANQYGVRHSVGRRMRSRPMASRSDSSVLPDDDYPGEVDEPRMCQDSGIGSIQRPATAARRHGLLAEMVQNKR